MNRKKKLVLSELSVSSFVPWTSSVEGKHQELVGGKCRNAAFFPKYGTGPCCTGVPGSQCCESYGVC